MGATRDMPDTLETCRQEALLVVDRCAQLLKNRYGAKRIIPFGSVLEEGTWHERSDLDLAVEGVLSEALWRAENELEAIVPPWLEVDLVPLERAFLEERRRILGERSMAEDPYLALKARLEDELVGLDWLAQGLEPALERTGETPDEFATRALATYVDDFYKRCERLCERVAVTLDGGTPQGKPWHRLLLGQMGEPGGMGRPPMFGGALFLELDEYRQCRHRVRHIYGYQLEAERVLGLARGVKAILPRIKTAVAAFHGWLEGQAGTSGEGQG